MDPRRNVAGNVMENKVQLTPHPKEEDEKGGGMTCIM